MGPVKEGLLALKRLALALALLWCAQGPLCFLMGFPFVGSHHGTADGAPDHARLLGEAHEHASATPPAPEAPAHHSSGEDPACAEHCASLDRALAADAAQHEPPAGVIAFVATVPADPLDGAPAAQLHRAREQPPPDLLLHISALRI